MRFVLEFDHGCREADVVVLATTADPDAVVVGDRSVLAQHGDHCLAVFSVPPQTGLECRLADQFRARPFVLIEQTVIHLDNETVAHAGNAG